MSDNNIWPTLETLEWRRELIYTLKPMGRVKLGLVLCLDGGIGRRKGLKIPWDTFPWGFDSPSRHQ